MSDMRFYPQIMWIGDYSEYSEDNPYIALHKELCRKYQVNLSVIEIKPKRCNLRRKIVRQANRLHHFERMLRRWEFWNKVRNEYYLHSSTWDIFEAVDDIATVTSKYDGEIGEVSAMIRHQLLHIPSELRIKRVIILVKAIEPTQSNVIVSKLKECEIFSKKAVTHITSIDDHAIRPKVTTLIFCSKDKRHHIRARPCLNPYCAVNYDGEKATVLFEAKSEDCKAIGDCTKAISTNYRKRFNESVPGTALVHFMPTDLSGLAKIHYFYGLPLITSRVHGFKKDGEYWLYGYRNEISKFVSHNLA